MNKYFNEQDITKNYPEAEELMFPATLVWKLPDNKKNKLSEVCSNGEYFLTEKIDGAFYQFVKTEHYSYLFGRTVSKVTGLLTEKSSNVPHIKQAFDCLPARTILIGEIYIPGGTSKDTVSIMGCLPALAVKKQENNPIHYYVHDIIAYDGVNLMDSGAETRYKILEAIWKKHDFEKYDFLRLAVKVEENLEEEIHRILNSGGEGAVLKKRDAPYIPDRRKAWDSIKVKEHDSIDLVCTGLCDATKEYTGKDIETWPYWEWSGSEIPAQIGDDTTSIGTETGEGVAMTTGQCQYGNPGWIPITKYYYLGYKTALKIGAYDNDGNLVDLGTVSSGLTDNMKRLMTEFPDNFVGKVVTLDCMSVDRDSMTLRHPIFRCVREDKNSKDCRISEVFNQ